MRKFVAGMIVGILVVPALLLGVILAGVFPVGATAEPPRLEKSLAGMALRRSVGHQAANLHNPLPANDETLLAGMRVFHSSCDGCHGTADTPSTSGMTEFYPRVPQFGLEPPTWTDSEMFWIAKQGIRYTGMSANTDVPDEQLWQVATFLARLNSLPPSVAEKWHAK
jgi:mono/diheme cytochrome c family protein